MLNFVRCDYRSLNARQKELYNFQKFAGRLADYGFNCMWLSDDWQGADFLAVHLDGETVLRVQLKARMVLERKYTGKSIHVAFRRGDDYFFYPHDALLNFVLQQGRLGEATVNWAVDGRRSWNKLPRWAEGFLENFRI